MANININGIDEHNLTYSLYIDECEYYDEEPLSYDEWLKQEAYEQQEIDRLFMTDNEKYGEEGLKTSHRTKEGGKYNE